MGRKRLRKRLRKRRTWLRKRLRVWSCWILNEEQDIISVYIVCVSNEIQEPTSTCTVPFLPCPRGRNPVCVFVYEVYSFSSRTKHDNVCLHSKFIIHKKKVRGEEEKEKKGKEGNVLLMEKVVVYVPCHRSLIRLQWHIHYCCLSFPFSSFLVYIPSPLIVP